MRKTKSEQIPSTLLMAFWSRNGLINIFRASNLNLNYACSFTYTAMYMPAPLENPFSESYINLLIMPLITQKDLAQNFIFPVGAV